MYKNILLTFCSLLLCVSAFSQDLVLNNSKTRAVVIGISDYNNEGIPDLKYAHKDALAFASYLESKSGGSLVKGKDFKLLINEQATSANMASALDWLLKVSKPKDRAIIYFSGHGDVESQTSTKHGFLLTYDSPDKVYISRAYPVFYLQSIVKTLSGKDIDVLMIADACRAGKLAGSEHNGPQATSTVLAQQLAKEIKILSCQTDEYSEESEAWGGGRGLFSYFLIRGLYGLADKNGDKQVSLLELTMYLTEKVSTNAQKSQYPKLDGSPKKIVSTVDEAMVKKLLAEPESQPLASVETTTRGMSQPIDNANDKVKELAEKSHSLPNPGEDTDIPDQEDPYILELREILTNQFWYALDNEMYLYPEEESALYYLEELESYIDSEESDEVAFELASELVWAMRDEVDEVINANLDSRYFYDEDIDASLEMVDRFAEYMELAVDILGPDHYMNDHLKSKELYLKALGDALYASIATMDADSLINQAIQYNLQALQYDPAAAYIYNDLGVAYRAKGDTQKAIEFFEDALELSPTWQIVLANLYSAYLSNGHFDRANEVKDIVLNLESDNPWIFYSLGNSYFQAEMYDEAMEMYFRALEMDYGNYSLYNAIGTCYFYGKGDVQKAEDYYRQALELAPEAYWPALNLANLLYANYRYSEAEQVILENIDYHNYKLYFYELLGNIQMASERYDEGLANYQKVLDLDYHYPNGHLNMMYYCAITGQNELALDWMESALSKGYDNYDYFINNSTYSSLQEYPKFQQLLDQYFGN